MIIPVKCFTCGKVLADKYEYYKQKSKELEKNIDVDKMTIEDINVNSADTYFDSTKKKNLLDKLGLNRICCRRHMLGHVDLIEII
jgi:DNA-directed RNA polymerase subunit N (RpoN/RPB10)